MILEIEIMWHTPQTRAAELAQLPLKPSDYEYRTMTFFVIDVICPFKKDDHLGDIDYCRIYAAGEVWIAPYPYEFVLDMINEARKRAGESPY